MANPLQKILQMIGAYVAHKNPSAIEDFIYHFTPSPLVTGLARGTEEMLRPGKQYDFNRDILSPTLEGGATAAMYGLGAMGVGGKLATGASKAAKVAKLAEEANLAKKGFLTTEATLAAQKALKGASAASKLKSLIQPNAYKTAAGALMGVRSGASSASSGASPLEIARSTALGGVSGYLIPGADTMPSQLGRRAVNAGIDAGGAVLGGGTPIDVLVQTALGQVLQTPQEIGFSKAAKNIKQFNTPQQARAAGEAKAIEDMSVSTSSPSASYAATTPPLRMKANQNANLTTPSGDMGVLPVNLRKVAASNMSAPQESPNMSVPMESSSRTQISAYHGTNAPPFPKFLEEKLGSGQGAQSFGHGFYFSDSDAVVKSYAEMDDYLRLFNGKKGSDYDSPVNFAAAALNDSGGDVRLALQKIRKGADYVSTSKYVSKDFAKEAAQILINGEFSNLPSVRPVEGNVLSVTIHKGKKPDQYDYMDWYGDTTMAQQNKIFQEMEFRGLDQGDNNIVGDAEIEWDSTGQHFYKSLARELEVADIRKKAAGGSVLEKLEAERRVAKIRDMGNAGVTRQQQKLASDFLLSAGIDGIKYKAGTLSGKRDSTATNYVVFDPRAITIESITPAKKYYASKTMTDSSVSTSGSYSTTAQDVGQTGTYSKEAESLLKKIQKNADTIKDPKTSNAEFAKAGKKMKALQEELSIRFPALQKKLDAIGETSQATAKKESFTPSTPVESTPTAKVLKAAKTKATVDALELGYGTKVNTLKKAKTAAWNLGQDISFDVFPDQAEIFIAGKPVTDLEYRTLQDEFHKGREDFYSPLSDVPDITAGVPNPNNIKLTPQQKLAIAAAAKKDITDGVPNPNNIQLTPAQKVAIKAAVQSGVVPPAKPVASPTAPVAAPVAPPNFVPPKSSAPPSSPSSLPPPVIPKAKKPAPLQFGEHVQTPPANSGIRVKSREMSRTSAGRAEMKTAYKDRWLPQTIKSEMAEADYKDVLDFMKDPAPSYAQQQLAVGKVTNHMLKVIDDLKLKLGSVTDPEIKKQLEGVIRQKDAEFTDLNTKFWRSGTELGRGLNARKYIEGYMSMPSVLERNILKQADSFKSATALREAVQLARSIPEGADIKAIIPIVKNLAKLRRVVPAEVIRSIWFNSIMGGTANLTNILGNASRLGWDVATHPLQVAADVLKNKAFGTKREVYFREFTPKLIGLIAGMKSGFRKAINSFSTGMRESDILAGKLPSARPNNAALRGLLDIVNIPSKGLVAGDELFRTIQESSAINQLAQAKLMQNNIPFHQWDKKLKEYVTDPNLIFQAKEMATHNVFQSDMGELSSLYKARKFMGIGYDKFGKIYPLEFLIPFIQTPINVLKFGLESSPAGFLAALGKKGREQDRVIASAAMGSAFFMWAASAIAEGNITGRVPRDKQERDAFYAQGKQPWSVRVGDSWIPFQKLEPFNTNLSMLATWYENWEYEGDKPTPKRIENYILSNMRNFTDQTFMKGVSDLMNAVEDPDIYGGKFVGSLMGGFMPFSGTIGMFAKAGDPYQRKPEAIEDFWKQNIPGLREKLPTVESEFEPGGVAKRKYEPGLQFSPIRVTKNNAEMEALAKKVFSIRYRKGAYSQKSWDSLQKLKRLQPDKDFTAIEQAILAKKARDEEKKLKLAS